MGDLSSAASWEGGVGLGGIGRTSLIRRAVRSRALLFGALKVLGHPFAEAFTSCTCERLESELARWAETWAALYPRRPKPNAVDVVLSGLLRADVSAQLRHSVFGGVSLESDLTNPCSRWLANDGYLVTAEVPAGSSRADVVGYKHGFLGRDIVLVELKNAVSELERLPDQIRDYGRCGDSVRVVMTPECLAEIALARDELATPLAYVREVEKLGASLWVYDATSGDFEQVGYGANSYDGSRYDALWQYLVAPDKAA